MGNLMFQALQRVCGLGARATGHGYRRAEASFKPSRGNAAWEPNMGTASANNTGTLQALTRVRGQLALHLHRRKEHYQRVSSPHAGTRPASRFSWYGKKILSITTVAL